MNSYHKNAIAFRQHLFDRLTGVQDGICGQSVQQLRESVARDLEELLNSRLARHMSEDEYPLVTKSILQFGIVDFVGLSTANPLDRDKICRSIAQSIAAQEPRLSRVCVEMLQNEQNMGALSLSIQGYLKLESVYEPVIFDALLKPATQQYMISSGT